MNILTFLRQFKPHTEVYAFRPETATITKFMTPQWDVNDIEELINSHAYDEKDKVTIPLFQIGVDDIMQKPGTFTFEEIETLYGAEINLNYTEVEAMEFGRR